MRYLVILKMTLLCQFVHGNQLEEGIRDVTNDSLPDDCDNDVYCDGYNPRYRTANGACNNRENPWLGMAQRKQARFLCPVYNDDRGSPRNSAALPSARQISNNLFNNGGEERFSTEHTVQSMGWGQFICHDVVATPEAQDNIDCCEVTNRDHPNCFGMPIPSDDPHFCGTDCLHFIRSAAVRNVCHNGRREQVNEVTSYIDGSMIYGSSDEQMFNLRDAEGGTLRMSDNYLLPEDPTGQCRHAETGSRCQLAGDSRVDEVPNLSLNHLCFVRIHNLIAKELAKLNSYWSNDRIFHETRKIVGALIQHVTYHEYLPMILGPRAVKIFDLGHKCGRPFTNQYNPHVDPTIRNGFAAAALRVGHTMIMPKVAYLSDSYQVLYDTDISDEFFNTRLILNNNGSRVQLLARWLTFSPSMETNRHFQNEVRNHLFGNHDLPARNIQRGRDHGLPPYNYWRHFCGLQLINYLDDPIADHDKESSDIIKALYLNEDDIDLYAGAVTELPVNGGLIGPTFQCIFIRQFEALKFGDSHWYERYRGKNGFTARQLKSIKTITLSRLFCRAFGLSVIQKDIFRRPSDSNPLVKCSSLPRLDLNLWKSDYH